MKESWIVGIYKEEIHRHVTTLGYRLTGVFDRFPFETDASTMPSLVIFMDDQFTNMEDLAVANVRYPGTIFLMMSAFREGQIGFDDVNANQQSVMRLVYSIREREYRFLN